MLCPLCPDLLFANGRFLKTEVCNLSVSYSASEPVLRLSGDQRKPDNFSSAAVKSFPLFEFGQSLGDLRRNCIRYNSPTMQSLPMCVNPVNYVQRLCLALGLTDIP